MSLDELKRTVEWGALTSKMRRFCEVFIETGDRVQAAKASYKFKNENSAETSAHQAMTHHKVIAVLNLLQGKDGRDEFLYRLRKVIEKRETDPGLLRLLELEARVSGFDVSGRKIQAQAQVKSSTVKERRERNITRIVKLREDRAENKKPEEAEPDDYGLEKYETVNGNQGNGSARE